jgi:hypothetical protein
MKALRRVALKPGESKALEFKLCPEQFALVDEAGKSRVRAGTVEIIAAGACPIPRSRALGAAAPVSARLEIR